MKLVQKETVLRIFTNFTWAGSETLGVCVHCAHRTSQRRAHLLPVSFVIITVLSYSNKFFIISYYCDQYHYTFVNNPISHVTVVPLQFYENHTGFALGV